MQHTKEYHPDKVGNNSAIHLHMGISHMTLVTIDRNTFTISFKFAKMLSSKCITKSRNSSHHFYTKISWAVFIRNPTCLKAVSWTIFTSYWRSCGLWWQLSQCVLSLCLNSSANTFNLSFLWFGCLFCLLSFLI